MKAAATLMGILVLVSSCAYQYAPVHPGERILYRNDIHSVLVLPFLDLADGHGDASDMGELFASELARFREVTVIHPAMVDTFLVEQHLALRPENVRDIAEMAGTFFNVQTVIIGVLTEYNAFYPPVAGISIELMDVETATTIATKSETYDSSFNYVRNALKEYARVKRLTDSLYKEDLILHRFDLYLRFVAYEFVNKYL